MNETPRIDFADLEENFRRVTETFRRFSLQMKRLGKSAKKLGRTLERDIARANRRPSLIHKGGKP
jgi:hypothetical protein